MSNSPSPPRRSDSRLSTARSKPSPSTPPTAASPISPPDASKPPTGRVTAKLSYSIATATSSASRLAATTPVKIDTGSRLAATTTTAFRLTAPNSPSATIRRRTKTRSSTSSLSPVARRAASRRNLHRTGTAGRRTGRRWPSSASATVISIFMRSRLRAATKRD